MDLFATQTLHPDVRISFKWLLQLVALNLLSKPRDVGSMTPRLKTLLLTNKRGKASQPTLTRKSSIDFLTGLGIDDLVKVLDRRVSTDVIVDGSQLDQLPEKSDVSFGSEVLVADDCLAHCFGLVFAGTIIAEESECLDAAFKLEGEAGGSHVFISGTDVVEKTCQGEG
ncbi:hypothetical protein HG530_010660 [Fusarium avenaceum]|nr:hypothetical protein HG530_010660 [Fusarium avenaceum]